jgi:general secretion pathway protein M
MLPSFSPREQRAVALGLLALLLAAAYGLLVHSWFTAPLMVLNQRLDELAAQQQRYAVVLGQRDALHQRARQTRNTEEDAASLLPGGDSSAAAADLMQRVGEQVKRLEKVGPGCVVVQRMPIIGEPVIASPYRAVRLSLGLECGVEALTRLLHGLEYTRPVLLVEQLDIARARSGPEQVAGGRLTVHLLITGYIAAAVAAPAAGPQSPASAGSAVPGQPAMPAANVSRPDDAEMSAPNVSTPDDAEDAAAQGADGGEAQ